ncbi:peroxiredoxin-like family protein [Algibacter sp. Ld11]|uniref:peroxiredoxin-like family protein n=1 Tax=Algibacter sp. Ld11 TaxID=649150 RepID=UPI00386BFBA8
MLPPEALEIFGNDAQTLHEEHSSILKLKIGDKAPDFTLSNAINEPVNLYDILKNQKVVLTFYRGTWCPYCNLVLVQYQAVLPEMNKAGATMIAISPQTPDQSMSIKEKNALQYEVLSDNGNIVSKQFTTVHKNPEKSLAKMNELGFDYDSFYADENSEIPVPATFVIEQDGTVSFAKSEGGDYRNRVEASDIINALNK